MSYDAGLCSQRPMCTERTAHMTSNTAAGSCRPVAQQQVTGPTQTGYMCGPHYDEAFKTCSACRSRRMHMDVTGHAGVQENLWSFCMPSAVTALVQCHKGGAPAICQGPQCVSGMRAASVGGQSGPGSAHIWADVASDSQGCRCSQDGQSHTPQTHQEGNWNQNHTHTLECIHMLRGHGLTAACVSATNSEKGHRRIAGRGPACHSQTRAYQHHRRPTRLQALQCARMASTA